MEDVMDAPVPYVIGMLSGESPLSRLETDLYVTIQTFSHVFFCLRKSGKASLF